MIENNRDMYILTGIGTKLYDLIDQKERGYNPGVKVLVKDARTLEVVSANLNIDCIEKIPEKPGSFHFTGIVSSGFRISDFFYGEESTVEGYFSANGYDVCPIRISIERRHSRNYISPSERKNIDQIIENRSLYAKWKNNAKMFV